MNPAHAHLLVNHIPLIAFALALPVLFFALIRREVPEVFRVGVMLVVVGAIASGISMGTGDEAEDLIEQFPNVEHSAIHDHEKQAEPAGNFAIAIGVLSLIGVFVAAKKPGWRVPVIGSVLVLSLLVVAAMVRVNHSGGLIRHEEAHDDFDGKAPKGEAEL